MLQERLQEFMIHKSLKASELSKILGVNDSNISNLINGRIISPNFSLVMKINKHFPELNLNWLVSGEGEMYLREPVQGVDEPIRSYRKGLDDYRDASIPMVEQLEKTLDISSKLISLLEAENKRLKQQLEDKNSK